MRSPLAICLWLNGWKSCRIHSFISSLAEQTELRAALTEQEGKLGDVNAGVKALEVANQGK